MLAKIGELVKTYQSDVVLALAIICISVLSFNLGKYQAFESSKTPIVIRNGTTAKPLAKETTQQGSDSKQVTTNKPRIKVTQVAVIASKGNKNKLFHYPWCPGYNRIAERNKLTFANAQVAIAAGYSQAANCK